MATNVNITVEPAVLESAANKIKGLQEEYISSYTALYNAVDQMGNSWEGNDKNAFVQDIQAYKKAFTSMQDFLTNTIDFLNKSAQGYRETQDKIRQAAASIGGSSI